MASTRSLCSAHYKGCLVGAVIGDCLGSFYEGVTYVPLSEVVQKVKSLKNAGAHSCEFTDDTAMTRSVAQSLIDNKQFDGFHMAQCFALEYKKEPQRGYGAAAPIVLMAFLEPERLRDVYGPADAQFNGSGSYGNGGAMRTAPVALFGYGNLAVLKDVATKTARLTHGNRLGYHGAVVQALAINLALESCANRPLDRNKYTDTLLEQVRQLESDDENCENEQHTYTYTRSLEIIRDLLAETAAGGGAVPTEKIVDVLGHDIRAHRSVPAAIYSFLRCVDQELEDEESEPPFNPFCHTILYAISLGGDTDTIASMAGAIAGAYHGFNVIPQYWKRISEGCDHAEVQADQLFNIVHVKDT